MNLFEMAVKVMIDKSNFDQGADEVRDAAEELASQVDESTQAFDSFSEAVAQNVTVNNENEQALQSLEQQIRESEQRLNEIADAVDNVNEEDEDFEQQLADLQAAYDQELDKLAELGVKYQDLSESTREAATETKEAKDGSESFGQALEKVSRIVEKVKTAVKGLVAYKVAKWFWDTTAAVAEYGDAIDENSQKMGISAQAYQKWDYIASRSGANFDSLKTSFRTLANQVEKNSDAFIRLGISLEDAKSMSQEDLFEAVIRGLQDMESGAERTYLANQLLGRGAQELGALLNASSGEVDGLKTRIEELGGIMSDKALKQAAAYDDALTDLQTAAQGVKNRIASVFMEFNTGVLNTIANAMGAVNRAFDAVTFDSYEAELAALQPRLEAAKASMEKLKQEGMDSGPAWDAYANFVSETEKRIEVLNGLINQTSGGISAQSESLAELQKAYAETFDAISETYEGWFGAFEKASTDVSVTFDEMMANVESQLVFWQNYEDNLHTLADAGFGDLVSAIHGMGPAGYEYAQVLADMARAGDNGIQELDKLQDAMAKVDQAREDAAAETTEILFEDNTDETIVRIGNVVAALDAVNGHSAAIYTYHYDVYSTGTWTKGTSRAGGLDYVPYHNYPAMLHEGERVLTKEENQRYNKGESRQSNAQPIQLTAELPISIDGSVIARKTYQFLIDLSEQHGAKLIHA